MFTERRGTLALLAAIILLALGAAWVVLPDNPGIHIHIGPIQVDRDIELRRGLDLQGGLQVLLEADLPSEEAVDPGAMEATRAIIEQRVNGLGVSEPLIQLSGSRRIIVELPGIEDPERAIETFGETGLLEFVDAGYTYLPPGTVVTTTEVVAPLAPITPTVTISPAPDVTPTVSVTPTVPTEPAGPGYETVLTGRHLTGADMGFGDLGLIEIHFELNDEGATLFGNYTRAHVGQVMCIVLDKQVVSCATINQAIPDGRVRITREGGFPPEEAESIVIRLRYGALPIPLRVETNRTVGPTLGEDSLRKSLMAGAIGLAVVVLFMLLYYRFPGLLADVALVIYAVLLIALFKLIPVVLTLPGIAGFILSVGMAVDANILIFERLKEELRAGKRLRLAVEQGFSRAWPSIRDSNFSTLITCAILFWFG
ncbi:MAG TPA: protein translocase subunit SecD, partial [Anaerolineae bacterium]|nr:protein translocase subunit SecD [Anaerolineae bacterium]